MVGVRGSPKTGGSMEKLNLSGRLVGPDELPYIIAEIGSNHNGDMQLAKQLIGAAKSCGADAVKFQSWSKSSIISKAEYARHTQYADKKRHFGTLKEMVEEYQLTPEQHREVVAYCQEKEIAFMSSCFSPAEVDLLDSLTVLAFKIASMDINHLSLLEYVASKARPVILSTGMATLGEIERALSVLQQGGAGPVALLHCVSIYPPAYESINLHNITTLQQAFDVPVGFSDHTLGTAIPLAAVALGACIIEKHFTLDKDMAGWDHAISADPAELEVIVREGQNVFTALGSTVRMVSEAEMDKRRAFRRRIVVKHAMKKGERLQLQALDFKRPGTGIHPDELAYVIGRSLARDVEPDDELEWSDLV
jgi:N,N'-diacetyllegionaminate synthase